MRFKYSWPRLSSLLSSLSLLCKQDMAGSLRFFHSILSPIPDCRIFFLWTTLNWLGQWFSTVKKNQTFHLPFYFLQALFVDGIERRARCTLLFYPYFGKKNSVHIQDPWWPINSSQFLDWPTLIQVNQYSQPSLKLIYDFYPISKAGQYLVFFRFFFPVYMIDLQSHQSIRFFGEKVY